MTDGQALSSRPDRCASMLGSYEELVRRKADALEQSGVPKRLWAKDATLWSADGAVQQRIGQRLGWLTLPDAMAAEAGPLSAWAASAASSGVSHVVLLGMGGSSLCAEVCRQVIGAADGAPDLTVLDTTDPSTILRVERQVDVRRALFLVASKSGGTVEVDALRRYFSERLRAAAGPAWGSQCVAITDPGTPLERQAATDGYRRCFLAPADVGGRFSALSYFGLVPAALFGIPVDEFLTRGAQMARLCRADQIERNPGVWLGLVLGSMAKAGRDKLTLVPSPSLRGFGLWVEQLVAESTGKEGQGVVPVDGEEIGAPETYGTDRLFISLELAGETAAAHQSQLEALSRAGHPLVRIGLRDRLDLAGEFFRWEVATAVAGLVLGANPFDEPNVTESKERTRQLLEAATEGGRWPEPEAELVERGLRLVSGCALGGSLAEAVWSFFRQAGPADYVALLAYLPQTDAHDAALRMIRRAIHDRLRVATTVGYGPRYLHSTGQLHKGGGDRGLFLLITSEEREDAPVPGRAYSFGVLKKAQALGDEAALAQRGRRVLRLHLGADVTSDLDRAARLITAQS